MARENVLRRWPGPSRGKGAAFPLAEARNEAGRIRRRFRSRTVILLGRRVAAAFGIGAEYFAETAVGSAVVVVVPHPSGVNRWFNEPRNVARMRAFMRGVVGGA